MVPHDFGEFAEQGVPRVGLGVHELLGQDVVSRRAAFDGIARERERRSGKPDEWNALAKVIGDEPRRVGHVAQRLLDVDGAQSIHVGG